MVISSTVSMVSGAQSDVASAAPSRRVASNSMSISHIGKTLGTLALLLSGGQAGASNLSTQGRRPLEFSGASYPLPPAPYEYPSLCNSGVVQAHIDGLTQEVCLDKEYKQIDVIRDTKPLGVLKNCYSISGYLSAGLLAGSIGGCIGGSVSIAGTSGVLAFLGLIPTTVCGTVYRVIGNRLEGTRKVAELCCRNFVSEESLAQNSNSTANTTTPSDRLLPVVTATNVTATNNTDTNTTAVSPAYVKPHVVNATDPNI